MIFFLKLLINVSPHLDYKKNYILRLKVFAEFGFTLRQVGDNDLASQMVTENAVVAHSE